MEMTFFVSLSVEEALERLNKRIDSAMSGWAFKVYRLKTPEGKQVAATAYRKYYMRTGRDYLVMQTVLDDLTGTTRVHFSGTDVKTWDFDLGAAAAFQNWMKEALSDSILPDP